MTGPTDAELARIEAEWPLIEAGLAVVELECRLAIAPHDELAAQALARARADLEAIEATHYHLIRQIGA